ncbi:MAG: hypothetical protein ABSF15_01230 [Candidatus Sulfotelmatobacter sp.]|jgi:hypothetical protein
MKFECFEERSIKVDKVRPVEWRSRSVTQNPGRWIDEAAGIEEFLYRRVTQLSITNLIRTIAECVPESFTPVNTPSGNPDAICDITLNCQPRAGGIGASFGNRDYRTNDASSGAVHHIPDDGSCGLRMDQARKQYGTAAEESKIQARTPHECPPF